MVLSETVIGNWANAIVDIAIKEKKVDLYLDQANIIIDSLKSYPDFVDILSVHAIDKTDEKRMHVIDEVFGKFDLYIVNAIKILTQMEAFHYVRTIFKKIRKQLHKYQDIMYGTVWSVNELTDKQVSLMEQKVATKLNMKIKLVNKIDKELIGGVKIIVANNVFDGSLQGKLKDLKQQAINNRE